LEKEEGECLSQQRLRATCPGFKAHQQKEALEDFMRSHKGVEVDEMLIGEDKMWEIWYFDNRLKAVEEKPKLTSEEAALFSAKVIPREPLVIDRDAPKLIDLPAGREKSNPTPTATPKPAPIVEKPAPADAETMQLALKDIIITGGNYRKNFNAEKIAELAASMNAVGQINAITVRPKGEKRFELIAGERRVRAARLNKWATIRAYVVIADDDRVLDIMAAENFGREDLDPIEAANAVAQAMRITGATQTKIAEKFGKSQPWVAQMLRIAEAPREMQDQIIRCLIMPSTAIELLVWADKPEYEAIWSKVKEELSNDEPVTQRRAREIIAAVARPAPTVAPEAEYEHILEIGDLPHCFGTEGNEILCCDCPHAEDCATEVENADAAAKKGPAEAQEAPIPPQTPPAQIEPAQTSTNHRAETRTNEAEDVPAPVESKAEVITKSVLILTCDGCPLMYWDEDGPRCNHPDMEEDELGDAPRYVPDRCPLRKANLFLTVEVA
jgi:ParB/RepB/Spo0J family partition protein